MVAINADGADFMAHFDAGCGTAVDLITGEKHDFGGGSLLPAYSAYFWLMENNRASPVMMAKPLWNLWKVFRISYGFSILTHDIICRIV